MASGDTLLSFGALANMPPASAFATVDTRNAHVCLDFDAGTDESAVFAGILPRLANTTVVLAWAASSATSGDVVWNVAWERDDTGTDLDADSFATANSATATTSATSGALTYTSITFTTGAQMDNIAAGERFRLKVTRDADNAADTMTGDAELFAVHVRET
jgi:hypothetical protein